MTLQDPWFIAKDEVCRALNKTRGLFGRWQELQTAAGAAESPGSASGLAAGLPDGAREELDWTRSELRNALRSIEWDLDDLDDTIRIVEKNPSKFNADNREFTIRRNFIEQTRKEIEIMKDKMNMFKDRDYNRTVEQPILESPIKSPSPVATHGSAKYSKLESETDSPNRIFIKGFANPNSTVVTPSEEQLEFGPGATGSSKTGSRLLQFELDERQFMLDDLENEMEIITETKLDTTMKKMTKVFHLSNGRRKWIVLGLFTAVTLVLAMSFLR